MENKQQLRLPCWPYNLQRSKGGAILLKLPKQVDPVNTMNIDSDTLCTNKYFQTIKQKILQLLKYIACISQFKLRILICTKTATAHKYLMSLSITKKDSCQQDKMRVL